MTTAVLLGVLQGVTEWLPVSSEGIVAAAYTLLEGRSLDEAVGLALWLHVGTLPAALIALRREVAQLCTDLVRRPTPPDAPLAIPGAVHVSERGAGPAPCAGASAPSPDAWVPRSWR